MTDNKLARESHDAAVLARLARDGGTRIQRLVARNPSTPWEVLSDLLATVAKDVIENPSLPLLLLADPGLFQRLHGKALMGLANVHRRLGEILGWTPDPPFTELQLTLKCIDVTRENLVIHRRYHRTLGDVRLSLVQRRALPAAMEVHLARDPDERIREFLAHRTKNHEIMELLLDDPQRHRALALNTHLHDAMQWALASSGARPIRESLALHSSASGELLTHLAGDGDAAVRAAVARNGRTPDQVRKKLAWDTEPQVSAAARRPPAVNVDQSGARRR